MNDCQNEWTITREVLETQAKTLGYSESSDSCAYWLIGLLPRHFLTGGNLVDFNTIGDPGAWLHNAICGHEIELLSDPSADDYFAGVLANAYIAESIENGLLSKGDFDSDDERQSYRRDLIEEFRVMIVAWREAVSGSLE